MKMANVMTSLRFPRSLRPDQWAVLAIMIVVVAGGIGFLDLMPGRFKGQVVAPKTPFRLIAAHEPDAAPRLLVAPGSQARSGVSPVIAGQEPGEDETLKRLKALGVLREELDDKLKALRTKALRMKKRDNSLHFVAPPVESQSSHSVDHCLIPAPRIDSEFVVQAPQVDSEFVVAPRVQGLVAGGDPADVSR